MIVIDIGCARYGGDYSIERLVEEFHPEVLYGFDPHPFLEVNEQVREVIVGAYTTYETEVNGCSVIVDSRAAWIYDGEIGFRFDGLNSWVTELNGAPKVPCFDIARFIEELPADQEIVLKIDAESSEFDLLRHLIVKGVDGRISRAIVEWHEPDRGRRLIEEEFAVPIEEWRW